MFPAVHGIQAYIKINTLGGTLHTIRFRIPEPLVTNLYLFNYHSNSLSLANKKKPMMPLKHIRKKRTILLQPNINSKSANSQNANTQSDKIQTGCVFEIYK